MKRENFALRNSGCVSVASRMPYNGRVYDWDECKNPLARMNRPIDFPYVSKHSKLCTLSIKTDENTHISLGWHTHVSHTPNECRKKLEWHTNPIGARLSAEPPLIAKQVNYNWFKFRLQNYKNETKTAIVRISQIFFGVKQLATHNMQRCLPHTVMSNTVEQCCHATELQRIFRNCRCGSLSRTHTDRLNRHICCCSQTVHSRAENCVSSMYTTLSALERNIKCFKLWRCVDALPKPREPTHCTPNTMLLLWCGVASVATKPKCKHTTHHFLSDHFRCSDSRFGIREIHAMQSN